MESITNQSNNQALSRQPNRHLRNPAKKRRMERAINITSLSPDTMRKKEGESQRPKGSNESGSFPNAVQRKMENAVETVFSTVNIHTNSAKESETGALVFPQGKKIHFTRDSSSRKAKKGRRAPKYSKLRQK